MKKTLFGTAAAAVLFAGTVIAETATAPTDTDLVPQMSTQDVAEGSGDGTGILVPVITAIIILLALGGGGKID